jgi:predicted nucleic acid-binding protein
VRRPRAYVETTVVSYLTARPSRDLIVAAHQQITEEWWQVRRQEFDLYISQSVLNEVSAGDPDAASLRLQAVASLPLLDITAGVEELAARFLKHHLMPARAAEDALHVATATAHGMEYLLTWNCRHIANAEIRHGLTQVAAAEGYTLPVICTPEELAGA